MSPKHNDDYDRGFTKCFVSKLTYAFDEGGTGHVRRMRVAMCGKTWKRRSVDDIHEYLLLKGVEAVAIHGSKDQEERDNAITRFKGGKADVLVATYLALPFICPAIFFDRKK